MFKPIQQWTGLHWECFPHYLWLLPFPPHFLLALTTVDAELHTTTIHVAHRLPSRHGNPLYCVLSGKRFKISES